MSDTAVGLILAAIPGIITSLGGFVVLLIKLRQNTAVTEQTHEKVKVAEVKLDNAREKIEDVQTDVGTTLRTINGQRDAMLDRINALERALKTAHVPVPPDRPAGG